ncbi:hypothetical protein FACS189459_5110 [Bacilli bacterium]|nr:hypothetical protein FACS189459_5110 [Bacilli bacterium]
MLNEYKPLDYTDTIFSVMVVFLFISIIFITYYIKAKKSKPNIAPKGFVLLMQIYFEFIDNMVAQVMGKKGSKITPYIVFLFTYLFFSNTIGIFGLSTPTGQLGVNISLALITFFGTFAFGFKYQKISYLKKYCFCCKIKGKKIPLMINPISFISMITPVISLSFRL